MTEFQWLQYLLQIANYTQGRLNLTPHEILHALEMVNSYRTKSIDNFDLINMLNEIKKERDENKAINKTLDKYDRQGYY
jgi:Ca2+-binding EF-hand superfamily protein